MAEILPGKGLGRVSSFGASRLSSTHRRRKPTLFSILDKKWSKGREATLVHHAPCVLCILYRLGINDRDVAGS